MALILRNGGSQSPDRWLKEPRNNHDIFLRYFKNSLKELIQIEIVDQNQSQLHDIPSDFLVNHISGSFVEMVLWWIQNKQKQTPEELDGYFRAVIEPILNSPHL